MGGHCVVSALLLVCPQKIVSLGDGASAELLSEGERALLFKASTETGQGSSGSISFGSGPGNGGTGTGVESSPSLWHLQDHPFAPPSSAVPLDCGAIAACEVDGDIIQPQPHVALPPLQLYPLLEGRGGQTGKVGRVLLPAEQEQQQQQPLRSTLRRDQSAVGQPQEGRHHHLQKRQHLHRHHRHGHRHGGAGGYRHHHYLAEHDNALFSGRMRSRSLCSTVSDLDPLDIPPSPVHQHLGEVEIPASPASLGGDLREGETEVRIRHGRSISVSVSISGTGGSDASSTSTVHHHHHHHHHHHLYLVHKGESNSREQHSVDTPASPSRPHHRRGRSASLFEPNTGSISLPKSGSLRIPPRSDHGRSHRRGTKYNDLLLSPKDAKRPRPTRANPPPNPQRQEKRLSTGDTSRTRPGHGHSQSAIDERTYLMRQDTTDSLGAYVGPAPQMHVPGLRNSGRGSSSRTSLYTDERTESRYSDCSDIPSEAGPHGFPLNSHHSASDQEANRSGEENFSLNTFFCGMIFVSLHISSFFFFWWSFVLFFSLLFRPFSPWSLHILFFAFACCLFLVLFFLLLHCPFCFLLLFFFFAFAFWFFCFYVFFLLFACCVFLLCLLLFACCLLLYFFLLWVSL